MLDDEKRIDFYETLGEAKAAAHRYADEDDAPWFVFPLGEAYHIQIAHQGDRYFGKAPVYTAEAQVHLVPFSAEEYAHYKAYIETERPDGPGHSFEGGMFETPVEQGILAKLARAFTPQRRTAQKQLQQ